MLRLDGLPKETRANNVVCSACGVLPLNYELSLGGIRTRIAPLIAGNRTLSVRVTFRARPEIRTPNKPGLSRWPLPVGLDARAWVPGDGLEPSRRWVRASVPRPRIPEKLRCVGEGGVGPLVGRLSSGCTTVVLRARSTRDRTCTCNTPGLSRRPLLIGIPWQIVPASGVEPAPAAYKAAAPPGAAPARCGADGNRTRLSR